MKRRLEQLADYCTVERCAKLLTMTRQGVYACIDRGEIEAYKIDSTVVITMRSVRNHRRYAGPVDEEKPTKLFCMMIKGWEGYLTEGKTYDGWKRKDGNSYDVRLDNGNVRIVKKIFFQEV